MDSVVNSLIALMEMEKKEAEWLGLMAYSEN